MRILQITSHLNIGGVARYIVSLSGEFRRRGHEVIIASAGGQLEPEARARGIAHWPVPLATKTELSPQVFAASQALASRLAQEPVDVIHAHTRVAQVVANRLSRRRRVPYVTTWHGFFRPNVGRWLWPCTGRRTIAISEPVRQHLLQDFHVPAERIRLIPNGIDPVPFESPVEPAVQQQVRDALHLPSADPVVGTVARLVPSKGVELLIRSLPLVRAAAPNTNLLIVGDGPERASLQELASSLGVRTAVYFSGSVADTRPVLSLMQVFVFIPADREGFGLSLLEAMASGCPVVAVRRGDGAPWVLDQGGVGLVVEPDDPRALAEGIIALLRNSQAARSTAEAARAVMKERYTLSRVADEVEAVYREVAG